MTSNLSLAVLTEQAFRRIMSINRSKPAFQPSRNWVALQKDLPETSKKRKRQEDESAPSVEHQEKEVQKTKQFTTYDPWHPDDSASGAKGNPALMIALESADNIPEFVPSKLLAFSYVRIGRYVSLDCEKVAIRRRTVEALGRISIVNYYGHVILDTFVKPGAKISDFRTRFSGIRRKDIYGPDSKGIRP